MLLKERVLVLLHTSNSEPTGALTISTFVRIHATDKWFLYYSYIDHMKSARKWKEWFCKGA